MKTLYYVSVEVGVMIVAESEREAILNASSAMREAFGDAIPMLDYDATPAEGPYEGWSLDCLVYGCNQDTTLEEAMKKYNPDEWERYMQQRDKLRKAAGQ